MKEEIEEISKRLRKVEYDVGSLEKFVYPALFVGFFVFGLWIAPFITNFFFPIASNAVTTPFELYQKASTDGKLAFIGVVLGSVLIPLVIWLLNHFWSKKKD